MSKLIARIREIQALLPGTVRLENFIELSKEQADLLLEAKPHMTDEAFVEIGQQMVEQSYKRLTLLFFGRDGLTSRSLVTQIAPVQRKFCQIKNLIDQITR